MRGMKSKESLSLIPFEVRWICHYDRGPLPLTPLKNQLWSLIHGPLGSESRLSVTHLDIDQGAPRAQGYCSDLRILESFFNPINRSLGDWLNDPRPIYRRTSVGINFVPTLEPLQIGMHSLHKKIFKKTFYVGNYDWIRWQRRQAYLRFISARA